MIWGAKSRKVVATARYASRVLIGPAWGPTSTTALTTSRTRDLTSSGVRSWTDRFRRRGGAAVDDDAGCDGAEVEGDDAATRRGFFHLGGRRADAGMKDAHCSHATRITSIRINRRRRPPKSRSAAAAAAAAAAIMVMKIGFVVQFGVEVVESGNLTSVNDRRRKDRPTGLTHEESHKTHKLWTNPFTPDSKDPSFRPWLSAAANRICRPPLPHNS